MYTNSFTIYLCSKIRNSETVDCLPVKCSWVEILLIVGLMVVNLFEMMDMPCYLVKLFLFLLTIFGAHFNSFLFGCTNSIDVFIEHKL